ncbi:MAG: HEAT repeat domain-containing protein [Acidobacteriota bacterium]|nr:HEAT repeat domain-containing protein [Blastocatellia bacterium]MDW8412173.1 HEAT repeat domain-containing protein [Acidobacteriota bacterium]
MQFVFYFLIVLLALWAFITIAQVAYSIRVEAKRRFKSEVRARFKSVLQQIYTEAGSPTRISIDEVVASLERICKDRIICRDVLIEFTSKLDLDESKPLRDAYERMGFVKQDIELLQNGKWQARFEAATRLGRMRCWSAIEVLNGAMRDKDEDVRFAAVCALAEIGDQYSIPAIVHALTDANGWQVLQVSERLLAMNVDVTHAFLQMLTASGGVKSRREAVIKTVLDLIADFAQRADDKLNLNAARAAAYQFVNSEQLDLRARAIRVFAATGVATPSEFELVLNCLSDRYWEIRAVAAKALGQIGDQAAVSKLTEALRDEAWWVRHNAAQALARLGQSGIEALQAQLHGEDKFAAETAKQVLEELQLDAKSGA